MATTATVEQQEAGIPEGFFSNYVPPRFKHYKEVSYGMGTAILIGSLATYRFNSCKKMLISGSTAGAGVILSQFLFDKYPEYSHAAALGSATFLTMRSITSMREITFAGGKRTVPMIWIGVGLVTAGYHLFII